MGAWEGRDYRDERWAAESEGQTWHWDKGAASAETRKPFESLSYELQNRKVGRKKARGRK